MEVPVKVKSEVPDGNDCRSYFSLLSTPSSTSTAIPPMALPSAVSVKEEPPSRFWMKSDEIHFPMYNGMWQYSNVDSGGGNVTNHSLRLSSKATFPPRGVRKKGLKTVCKPLIKILTEQLSQRSNSTATMDVPTDLCKLVKLLIPDANDDYAVVQYLIGQLHSYCCQRPKPSKLNVMRCLLLYLKNPKSYSHIRKCKLLSLPSVRMLKRYIGYTTIENELPALVQRRLSMEVASLHYNLQVASLIIEGADVRVSARRRLVGWMDNIFGEVNTKFGNSTEMLPLYLLGFSLQGPFVDHVVPVVFYLINNVTSSLIHIYILHVLRFTEKLGIRVLRIQGNGTGECYDALKRICGGRLRSEIPHLLDCSRVLYVGFDPSEVIKNVGSCFLSEHRQLVNNGRVITAVPLKDFYLEHKSRNSMDKSFPTRKHLFPDDSAKDRVKRAIEIFSVRARKTLVLAARYVKEEDVVATVKFMKFMTKWFRVHDALYRGFPVGTARNSSERPVSFLAKNSIVWLASKFLVYLETWRKSCRNETQFLGRETYEALVVTTQATLQFFGHLFDKGLLDTVANHWPSGTMEHIKAAFLKIKDDATVQHLIHNEADWETFFLAEGAIRSDATASFSDSSGTGLTSNDEKQQYQGGEVKRSTTATLQRLDEPNDGGSGSIVDDGGEKSTCTARKTQSDMSLLKRYLASIGEHREVTDIPVDELDDHLCSFIWSVRRKDGQEFKPHSLRCILSSVNRYLAGSDYGHTIFNDGPNSRFPKTKDALTRKQSELRRAGRRNRWHRGAHRLKGDEVERLYSSGTLSLTSAQGLLTTVFFHNHVQFGLKISEHHQLLWGDVRLLKDSGGKEYLECSAKSANRKGGRPIERHIYHDEGNPERDPIAAYKAYAAQRPSTALSPDSPFYLSVNGYLYPRHVPWYRPAKLGRHKITQMLEKIQQSVSS